jgi:VanZ family protein
VPGRTADVLDWVADTLGAGLGALLGSATYVALRRPGRAG